MTLAHDGFLMRTSVHYSHDSSIGDVLITSQTYFYTKVEAWLGPDKDSFSADVVRRRSLIPSCNSPPIVF
jgi:hypothetical protein